MTLHWAFIADTGHITDTVNKTVFTDLNMSEPVSIGLDSFGQVWTSVLDMSVNVWIYLDSCRQVWEGLDSSGEPWTGLYISWHVWTDLDLSKQVWTYLYRSGQFWIHLDRAVKYLIVVETSWFFGQVWICLESSGLSKYLILEYTARYAGLHLAPAEGCGLQPMSFLSLRVLAHFRPFLVSSCNLGNFH